MSGATGRLHLGLLSVPSSLVRPSPTPMPRARASTRTAGAAPATPTTATASTSTTSCGTTRTSSSALPRATPGPDGSTVGSPGTAKNCVTRRRDPAGAESGDDRELLEPRTGLRRAHEADADRARRRGPDLHQLGRQRHPGNPPAPTCNGEQPLPGNLDGDAGGRRLRPARAGLLRRRGSIRSVPRAGRGRALRGARQGDARQQRARHGLRRSAEQHGGMGTPPPRRRALLRRRRARAAADG